jgi:hypothetical protein
VAAAVSTDQAQAEPSQPHLEAVPAQEAEVENEPAAPVEAVPDAAAQPVEAAYEQEEVGSGADGPSEAGTDVELAPPADAEAPAEVSAETATPVEPAEPPTQTEEVRAASSEPEPEGEEGPVSDDIIPDEGDVEVAFARTAPEEAEAAPPPLKRVQVSSQMDILAELDSLRKHATMGVGGSSRDGASAEVDLDSLLAGGAEGPSKEFRRKVDRTINSDVFERMRAVQVAIRIQDSSGDTIHTLEPVALVVDDVSTLEMLSLLFTFNLENSQ